VRLVEPSLDLLPGYVDALERGWSFDSHRVEAARREELEEIARDAAGFVARQVDREANGPPVTLPDGSRVPRLPGYRLWMWDDGFCGAINLRWQPGTHRLAPHCLGHIGYAVVPWKRRRGCATRALGLIRERIRAEGLRYVDIVADLDNAASRKVIVANGGCVLEPFRAPAECGGADCLRFRWYTGAPHPIERETGRLRLRQWRDADREPFAAMNADPRVMEHFRAPLSREESDGLAARFAKAIDARGWGLWAVEGKGDGRFLGFVGLTPVPDDMPFAPAVEIGWRLAAEAWGAGYATEAAREALRVAFETLELREVVSYTALTNQRSMAVMRRLGMREDGAFDHPLVAEGHRLRPHRLFRLAHV
jgi:RimJ/RimL family protein N-acetyltransferase